MTEITLHIDNGHVRDIHFDGQKEGVAISAFLLLTSVPVEPEAGHVLCYGNSEKIGQMLFNFWKHSVKMNPELAWVTEKVAQDIIEAARQARGPEWQGDGPVGNA